MDLHDAETLGHALLAEHGLTDWRLGWDRAVKRAGQTRFRDSTITLSRRLTEVHSVDEVRETLLHEIAHALVGPRHGHDETWRRVARRIGATGRRCVPDDSPRIDGRWRGTCPAGHVVSRHRVPTRVSSCRTCAPRFDVRHRHTWTLDGVETEPHPAYAAELARLLAGAEGRPAGADLTVGSRVRIVASGRYRGRVGTISQCRRTRFAVRLGRVEVTVPFALVEPA